jgi:CRISPR-associated protein Cmr2
VQDLDRLGRALSGLGLAQQRAVSGQLADLGELQRLAMRADHPLAVPVYAGGDDLLAFCPAAAALDLAAAIRRQVDVLADGPLGSAGADGGPITASTAVVFTHMSSPLQAALAAARSALRQAKSVTGGRDRSRDALAVVVRTRGGERGATVQPWRAGNAHDVDGVTLLGRVRPSAAATELSAGLVSRLERDQDALDELASDAQHRRLLVAELRRLVERQGGRPEEADALHVLGVNERSASGSFRPVPAALVARFLTREAR